jgi:hypothetical protein
MNYSRRQHSSQPRILEIIINSGGSWDNEIWGVGDESHDF